MSHLVVFVFLLVVAGLSTVDSQFSVECEKPVRKRGNGLGGICFGTQDSLLGKVDSCESIVPWTAAIGFGNGCLEDESCCVDCGKQTKQCDRKWSESIGRKKCCEDELLIGEVRPDSGCYCCKDCKRKDWCRRQSQKDNPTYCVTEDDPVNSVANCIAAGGRVKLQGCHGNDCHCCIPTPL